MHKESNVSTDPTTKRKRTASLKHETTLFVHVTKNKIARKRILSSTFHPVNTKGSSPSDHPHRIVHSVKMVNFANAPASRNEYPFIPIVPARALPQREHVSPPFTYNEYVRALENRWKLGAEARAAFRPNWNIGEGSRSPSTEPDTAMPPRRFKNDNGRSDLPPRGPGERNGRESSISIVFS